MSENLNLLKKDELIDMIKNKEDELKNKDDELKNVKLDIESLKEMFLSLQNNNTPKIEKHIIEKPANNVNDNIVRIGSCLIGKHYLCDNTGAEVVELEDVGDVASVSMRILDTLMTSRNKALFKDGLIFFLDNSLYDRYSIKKNFVLDEDTIDNIYKMSPNDMIKEIDKLTNEGRNEKVKYSIYWAFVKNIASGKSGYNDKSKEIMLANYFKADINNSIGQLNYCKEIGYF